MNDKNDIWKDEQLRQLADVLASISDPNEIRAFLRDVMTQKEIIEVGARLQAAKMLSKGEKYADSIKFLGQFLFCISFVSSHAATRLTYITRILTRIA
jgi:uncharacterized protein YerC